MPVAAAVSQDWGCRASSYIQVHCFFRADHFGSRHPEKFILLFWWSVNAAATHEKFRLPALPPPDVRAGPGLSGA